MHVTATDPDTNSLRHLHQFPIINPNEKKLSFGGKSLLQRIPIPTPQRKGKPPGPQNLRLLAGAPIVLASRCRGSRTPTEVERSRELQDERSGIGSTEWRWRRRRGGEAAARRGAGGTVGFWVLGFAQRKVEAGKGKGRAYQVAARRRRCSPSRRRQKSRRERGRR